MGLFARRPSKPDVLDEESLAGLEVIRRTKVTIDRYWVAKEEMADEVASSQSTSAPVGDEDEAG